MKTELRLLITGSAGPYQLANETLMEPIVEAWQERATITMAYRDSTGALKHGVVDGATLRLTGDGPGRMIVGEMELPDEAEEPPAPKADAWKLVEGEIDSAFAGETIVE